MGDAERLATQGAMPVPSTLKKTNETKNKKEKSIKVPTVFLSLSPLPSSLKTDATFKYLLLHCRS